MTWWPRRHSNAWRTGEKVLVWLPSETWRNCEAFHRAAACRSCSPMALRSTCFEVQTWLKTSGIRPRRAPPGWWLLEPKAPCFAIVSVFPAHESCIWSWSQAREFFKVNWGHNKRLFLPHSVLSFYCLGKINKQLSTFLKHCIWIVRARMASNLILNKTTMVLYHIH